MLLPAHERFFMFRLLVSHLPSSSLLRKVWLCSASRDSSKLFNRLGVGPKLFFTDALRLFVAEATLEEFLDLVEEESSQIVQLERTSTELGVDGINY